ncbi:MAG TPA: hypothetical protein VGT05_00395 [Patescibacteria group bacterium]|nr:hypothetical protein [Patescibacteria group bacterium]
MSETLPYGEQSFCFSYNAVRRSVSALKLTNLPDGRGEIILGTDFGRIAHIPTDRKHPPLVTENGVLVDTTVSSYFLNDERHYSLSSVDIGKQFGLGRIRTGDKDSTGDDGICIPLREYPWLLAYGWSRNANGASYLDAIYKLTRSHRDVSLLVVPQGQEPHVLEYKGENNLLIHKDPLTYLRRTSKDPSEQGYRSDYNPEIHLRKLLQTAEQARRRMRVGMLHEYLQKK